MLKAVVEQHDLAFKFLDRRASPFDPIGMLQMGHVGQSLLEFERLVIPRPLLDAVAATDDRDPDVALAEPAGDPLDERRFAGAAEREVADANDRRIHFVRFGAPRIVARVPDPHGRRVTELRQPQPAAQQHRPDAPTSPGNELAKPGGGEERRASRLGGRHKFATRVDREFGKPES